MCWSSFRNSDPQEPVRIGLLVNPHSRGNRRANWLGHARRLLGPQYVCETQTLQDIPLALETLLDAQQRTVLAISGGDGTLHHVLNVLCQRWKEQRVSEPGLRLPPVLLLRGGTLNVVARALDIDGHPLTLLRQFVNKYRRSVLGDLQIVQQRVLEVSSPHWGTRVGFIFGSNLTAVCLELYERQFGGGYVGLARFLAAAVGGFVLNTDLWRQHKHLMQGPVGELTIDERRQLYMAVVASTVDIKILGGLVEGMVSKRPTVGTMRVRLLGDITARKLFENIPRLLLGQAGEGIHDYEEVRSLECSGDFSLDGESYLHTPLEEDSLQVTSPGWVISMILPPK